ncbi:MAG: cupin domain-containing protein [Planctomycetota bacterium]
MGFVDIENQPAFEPLPGVRLRTPHGEQLMLSVVEMDEGSEVPLHSHHHEQAGILLEGRMLLRIGDEEKELGPGEMYIIPGGSEHRALAVGGPIKVLDVFSPIREDYAAQTHGN